MTAAEAAPRLALAAVVSIVGGIAGFVAASSSDPMAAAVAPAIRQTSWFLIAVGLLFGVATVIVLRRAARNRAAYTRTELTREDVHKLSPTQFEAWCAARLTEQGYRVAEVGGQSDHGVDLIAEREGERVVVQCKRWLGARLVGEPQVRDLFGAMQHERANGAMVITTGVFSAPAVAWAQGKPIRLWDVDRLVSATPADAIIPAPVSAALPRVCPACGRPMVRRVNRQNQQAFYGCTGFPKCRHTEPA